MKMVPYIIKNPETVNERRQVLGLERFEDKTEQLQADHDAVLKANVSKTANL